jgi:FAD:protein FMN transferase
MTTATSVLPSTYRRSARFMNTTITIDAVERLHAKPVAPYVARAFQWFGEVERCCSRFDRTSELMQLCARVGAAVKVSPLLFDPAMGQALVEAGFNRNFRTGELVTEDETVDDGGSFRDIAIDAQRGTIALRRPLTIDLGAVAKGLAVDLAARELRDVGDFAIDAGGDRYLHGRDASAARWPVVLHHPRIAGHVMARLRASELARCPPPGSAARRAPIRGCQEDIAARAT